MAGPSLREDSPRGRASAGNPGSTKGGAVTGIPAIVVLLALGLILRFIIAQVLLPGSGFPNDLTAFQSWGNDIAQHGPVGFYARTGFIDYPPVYLLFLSAVSFLTGGNMGDGVKLLPILADAGLAAVVWQMAREMGVTSRRAFLTALIVLVNPITWFNSAIWGQADAVGSIFLLLGLRELQRDHRETASALAVLAVLTKLQLGILGFIVAFVVVRRSLAPKEGPRDPERILTSIGAGIATAALICLPFTGLDFSGAASRLATMPGIVTVAFGLLGGVGVFSLAKRYLPIEERVRRLESSIMLGIVTVVASSAMAFESIANHILGSFGEYPYLTLNAYNPWVLLTDAGNAMSRNLGWLRDGPWTDETSGLSSSGFVIGPFSSTAVFAALVLCVVLVAAAVVGRMMSRTSSEPSLALDDPASAAAAAPEQGLVARLAAEFAGMWAAFAVAAVVIAGVVALAEMSGRHFTLSLNVGQILTFNPNLYALALGDGLLIITLIAVSAWAAWRDDAQSLLVAVAILTIAFFVEPTRAHERYLFPFFGIGAVLLSVSRRWAAVYVILAVANAANLLAVLVEYQGIPSADGQLAGTLNDWGRGILSARWFDDVIWPIALCGVLTGLAMVWALLQLRPRAAAALGREVAGAAAEPESGRLWSNLFAADYDARPYSAAHGRLAAADTEALPALASGEPAVTDENLELDDFDDEWTEEDEYLDGPNRPIYVPRTIMMVWRRIAGPSNQPDRSAALDSEPRGRIGKLDIWVVVALVIAVLSIRIYRLDEPMQMHFDEVYHARTATEFLQDWRYGTPYNLPGSYVYEWTHPHFAKYAIAAGITLFSDDKVTATGSLGSDITVKDVRVQPRTSVSPLANASDATDVSGDTRYGDRVFVATGSAVGVYDLETRALVHEYDIPGASAFSEVRPDGAIFVGTSTGRIYKIDTVSLDNVRLGISATYTPPTLLTVDAGIAISHVYSASAPYLLVGNDKGDLVSIDLTQAGGTIVAHANIPAAADFAALGAGPQAVSYTPPDSASASATPTETSSATPTSEAQQLASALGLDVVQVQSAMDSVAPLGTSQTLNLGTLTDTQIAAVKTLIGQGALPDMAVEASAPQVLVAYEKGIGIMDAQTLVLSSTIETDSPATSIAVNLADLSGTSPRSDQSSYVAAGDSLVMIHIDGTTTPWTVTKDSNQLLKKMPGPVTKVVFDRATRIAQALGRTADGKGWTVYAIESNGNAVFSDAVLPFQPVAIGLDSTPMSPDSDREQLIAIGSDGSMATVDVGQFAFSWRIMGVIFGALMAACLYLLVRLLFKRRSVALLVALLTLTDGMFFVQSRIAMNDTYVGGFLLLAYLIFAVLWLQVFKNRFVFWLGMPLLGITLGLALASKWVAMYAIASIGILILVRSALGRLITIVGLAAGTGVLGWQAIAEMTTAPNTGSPAAVILLIGLALAVVVFGLSWASSMKATPDKVFVGGAVALTAAGLFAAALAMSPQTIQNGAPNYTFFLIMLAITSVAAAANAYHPIAWTREELRFAVALGIVVPVVVGVLATLYWVYRTVGLMQTSSLSSAMGENGTLLKLGMGGLIAAAAVAVALRVGGKMGFGPLAPVPAPDDPAALAGPPAPAPTGWLRLGSGYGLPAAWMAACLLVLPIVVYIALYLPWAMPWQSQTDATGPLPAIACWHTDTTTGICDSAFPAGHTGQNLYELTFGPYGMYAYHNDLRASHAASSPWWAWPMDLKPVWFENANYAGGDATMIFDGGNPAVWWLAIFGMAFVCWQAFKRRSLGLTLIAVAFFWQWLSWSRIDRAAFQYHFYTALPFFLAALAYLLAELWHGPSRRTWLLARFAAAAALVFPAAVWLLKYPLCGLVRVDTSQYFQNIICGNGTGDVRIEMRMLLIAFVLLAAMTALALVLWRLERRQSAGIEDSTWIGQLLAPVAISGILLWWLGQNGPRDIVFQAAAPPDLISIVMLILGILLAAICITARNPRRFVLGACAVAIIAFVALYPNLSALPMPGAIVGLYNGFLPTWFYGFQFSDNLQQAITIPLLNPWSEILALLVLVVAGFVGWAAWERRVVVGFRRSRAEAAAGAGTSEAAETTEAAGTTAAAEITQTSDGGPASDSGAAGRRSSRKDKPSS
ncbi:MAG TPA: phospholipid carrier-dependent glycosyltransferase [Candidatus Limnocylindrales bacterium]